VLVNTAYAFLAEACDAADRIAEPTLYAAGMEPDDIADMSRRKQLDDWLAAPMGREAEDEQALLTYLKGA
jgi:hypothetical protein